MDEREIGLEFLRKHASNAPTASPAPSLSRASPLTHKEISALAAGFAPIIADYVKGELEPLRAENAELRSRVDALEAKVAGPNLRRVV